MHRSFPVLSLSPFISRSAVLPSTPVSRAACAIMGMLGLVTFTLPPAQAATATTHHRATHRHATTAASASGNPVILTSQPGTELDKQARLLNAEDIATSRRHKEEPLVLIGSASLSTRKGESAALFVELQSAALCGSAGCSADVYLRQKGEWVKILDSVSGEISVLPTSHRGMHDLMIDGTDKWVWDGSTYQDTIGAAPIGNLRGEIEQFQEQKSAHKSSTKGH
ncbi:hypothetical protein KUA11_01625 [Acetobacter estunensis]|nr:hypothetical protein [Acetobacter estunensis]MBV1835910.1 hypothetical protein [Acetobacter estunensis]